MNIITTLVYDAIIAALLSAVALLVIGLIATHPCVFIGAYLGLVISSIVEKKMEEKENAKSED